MTSKLAQAEKQRTIGALARDRGVSPAAADAIAAIDAAMTRIRRSMQRRELGRLIMERLESDLEMAHFDVISAIGGFTPEPVTPGTEVTVGFVAEQLNVDPSRASRLVGEVVERGYARRVASQQDSRRICLELTERGRDFVQSFQVLKWEIFANSLATWSDADLTEFARLLERFAHWPRHARGETAPKA